MNTKLVLIIPFLLATVSTAVRAEEAEDEEDDRIAAEEILLEKDLPASVNARALHVTMHKAGHVDARPFVVEVSERCPSAASTQDEARVIDTVSSCDLAPASLGFDAATSELSFLVRQPDAEGTCGAKPKKIVMQLQSACNDRD